MKIWLDDERPAPNGWIHCWTVLEAFEAFLQGEVTHMSLDHDLGTMAVFTGYDLLCWIEERIAYSQPTFSLPVFTVHSANPVGRKNMEACLQSIYRLENVWKQQ